tara:strand:- start:973 stop:2265 length:1293 start_codon:yes stop_codon:yes gene_type:complete
MLSKIKSLFVENQVNKNFLLSVSSLKDLEYFNGAKNIFLTLKKQNSATKLMLVGGCVRKLLNREEINDVDIAINLIPDEIKNILRQKKIQFIDTGISHGTITVIVNKLKFELTTLRKDTSTDGRHADVEFISDWEIDAKRRDFTINAIYSNLKGEIYDPLNGVQDLSKGVVKFIGDPNNRIKEDYLRILRYLRFYTQYSKLGHQEETIKAIKLNLEGLVKISKERILDELYKILKLNKFYKLFEDNFSCTTILSIIPQLKNYERFKIISKIPNEIYKRLDATMILSILLIDNSDNCEFFLYKFKLSNKDKKRILFLYNSFKKKDDFEDLLNKKKLIKLAYLNNVETVIDLLVFSVFTQQKKDINKFVKNITFVSQLELPVFPITGNYLKSKYNFSEGKELGTALKKLESFWIDNDFKINEKKIKNFLRLE